MVKRTELQLILVFAFLVTLGILAYGPSTMTGLATYEVDGQRAVVILKESPALPAGNLITGNAIGTAPEDVKQAKKEIIDDVNDAGFFGLLSTDEVEEENELDELPAMVVEASEEGIRKLKEHPLVKEVIIDFPLELYLDDSVPLINASRVHSIQVNGQNLTGEGIAVCYVDTGITPNHAAFTGRIVNQKCFCQGCCQGSSTSDDATDTHSQGHGTHVAGIIGADGQKKGVAPGVDLVAVKVCGNSCMLTDVLSGMNYCVQQRNNYNIKVMSVSLGDNSKYKTQTQCPTYLDSAINSAHGRGILTTIASGNNGFTDGISYPACSPEAMAVGATTKGDGVAGYSNRGQLLDMLAPGSSIVSALKNGGYGTLSGTSMAAPHVAGAAALLFQYAQLMNMSIGGDNIRSVLQNGGKIINGWPRVDVYKSLLLLGYTPIVPGPSVPWNFTITSPNGRVQAENILFNVNITGNHSNSTNFTVTWESNKTGLIGTGESLTANLSIGNHTILVVVEDGNNTLTRELGLRVVPVTNCSIDIDVNRDGIVDMKDLVLLSQQTNISCVAPMAMPNCLVDVFGDEVDEAMLQELLDGVNERHIVDVYGEECIVELEE